MIMLLAFLVTTACSSTLHYAATGYYADTPDGMTETFESEDECAASGLDSCTRIQLTWETERYCGIYRSAENAVSEQVMMVGTSPFAITGWQVVNDQTLLLGDDENFERVDGDDTTINSDVLCGKFEPAVNLLLVRDKETVNLEISCQPIMRGIKLMPSSSSGYPLKVIATVQEKSWFGCKK
jgi:hypothetical protein